MAHQKVYAICENKCREETLTKEQIEAGNEELRRELDVERARIDQLKKLPDGSTTGDAELQDIRIGYDSQIHSTAGEAVRTQVRMLADRTDNVAIKKKIKGNGEVTCADGTNWGVVNLIIEGKTEQVQTTGKNILNIPDIDANTPETVIECNISKDICISAQEKATVSKDIWRLKATYKDNTTAYIADSKFPGVFYATPENPIVSIAYRSIYIINGSYTGFMVEYGTTATTYEPYTSGKPSPSPEYPRVINNVGKFEGRGKYTYQITIIGSGANGIKVNTDAPLTKWDTIEKMNGNWGYLAKSNIIKSVVSNDWKIHNQYGDKITFALEGNKNAIIDSEKQYCNMLNFNFNANNNAPINTFMVDDKGTLFVVVSKEKFPSVTEWKAHLAENQLEVQYETPHMKWEKFSTETQAILNRILRTSYPSTNISVQAGDLVPVIIVEYVLDTTTIFKEMENKKLDKNLGAGNRGKMLGIDAEGNIIPVQGSSSGGSGTSDYNDLINKPSINNVELSGNKTLTDLGIRIPTKLSELHNDSGFLTNVPSEFITDQELLSKGFAFKKDIPKSLPNPHALTFTGAVTGSYDGSAAKTIHIPTSGGAAASNVDFVSPEDFGARGDGVTDDSEAFKQAILTQKKVVCKSGKKYFFSKPVDVRQIYYGHLDINHATLVNFHILINLNDAGNDWRQSYPIERFTIENGAIGSGDFNSLPKDWSVPVIKTGAQMRIINVNFVNQPYIMAVANQYLDYMYLDSLLFVRNHSLFKSGMLTNDAVSVIGPDGNAKRIDQTATTLAGDSWIFKQCSEFYSMENPEYKLVTLHSQSPAFFIECIQSGVRSGIYSHSVYIGCHWEEAPSMPVYTSQHLCSATFIGCYFWGNYVLVDDPRVQYKNCLFTQTVNNHRLPHYDLAHFTGNKSFYDLKCRMESCCVGGNYIIDTEELKRIKREPKRTFNSIKDYRTKLSTVNMVTQDFDQAKFAVGAYTYDIWLLGTQLMNLACDHATKQVTINKEKTQVWTQVANAIGGYGFLVVRTNPDGSKVQTFGYTDPWYSKNFAEGKNIVFYDYGEWAVVGYNDGTVDGIYTQLPSPWISVKTNPQITVNNKVYEASGVLITSDNSKITGVNGMIQVSNSFQ